MKLYEDPYFNDVPWEIIYDDHGQVIGVVYILIPKRVKNNDRN